MKGFREENRGKKIKKKIGGKERITKKKIKNNG